MSGIRTLLADSANFKRNSQNVGVVSINLRNPATIAESVYICRIHNENNVPTSSTLQLLVRGMHGNFVNGIHLHFGTWLKTCLWNPGTYRHKIVRLQKFIDSFQLSDGLN